MRILRRGIPRRARGQGRGTVHLYDFNYFPTADVSVTLSERGKFRRGRGAETFAGASAKDDLSPAHLGVDCAALLQGRKKC